MTDCASQSPILVDIVVADGFVLTEFTAIVELLRTANRVTAKEAFRWRWLSKRGGVVGCRAGITIDTHPFDNKHTAQYVFVLGNSDPDAPDLSMRKTIKAYQWAGARVILLSEAASRYISETGEQLMSHTTHWENRALLNERGTPGMGSNALAADDGQITTSAGMGATYDLVLGILGDHLSAAAVATVTDIFLHETIRTSSTLQPFGGKELSRSGNRTLDQCIELMQANLEEPLRISELAGYLNISERSLERQFRKHFGTSPNAYYRELRLNQANTLLLKTSMSVRDVGLACGFSNGFSTLFGRHFGVTPTALRRARGPAG
ncbi:AraC family transcriptional regulator [Aliiroseovarius zhejiangensis]|uniref:AraC family transcriptional regulator n=1 Tax=Aliiroseovarius zhejiangensis TaxID=1632025 RepID=A0ABQ3J6I0_9RHOB|nr:helix-turn-helix domain-containing protein [Aliiroseovarius zhejiangensis]GHF07217.1 AraC family transcriptional regulator [Aliiroseovarius zhejiangensis]